MNPVLERELVHRLSSLPPEKQQAALEYVRALEDPRGIPKSEMLRFAAAIGNEKLEMMVQALEEDCEEVPVLPRVLPQDVDWDEVEKAFASAAEQFGWDAAVSACPAEGRVTITVPESRTDRVAETNLDLYTAVEERVGQDVFMNLDIDYFVSPD